jgi:CheY-like chemotaxis protein
MGISPDIASASRLLVVEDSDEDVFFLQRAFTKVGFLPALDHVEDGLLAQDYLEGKDRFGHRRGQLPPRLILSDIKMPICTGLELLAWLRNHPTHRHVPVVMWSSSDYEQDVQAADAVGAAYYLQKPQTLAGFMDVARTLQQIWMYDCDRHTQASLANADCRSVL